LSLLVVASSCDNGMDTHMSIYLNLKMDRYDDELSWPLRGRFEIKLLNQISNCNMYIFTYGDNSTDRVAALALVVLGSLSISIYMKLPLQINSLKTMPSFFRLA